MLHQSVLLKWCPTLLSLSYKSILCVWKCYKTLELHEKLNVIKEQTLHTCKVVNNDHRVEKNSGSQGRFYIFRNQEDNFVIHAVYYRWHCSYFCIFFMSCKQTFVLSSHAYSIQVLVCAVLELICGFII